MQKYSLTNTGTGLSFLIEDEATDTSPFVIDSTGNLGLGTTAPASKLDVLGTAWLRGGRGNTTGLFVDINGNVGIGTTAPGGIALNVNGIANIGLGLTVNAGGITIV